VRKSPIGRIRTLTAWLNERRHEYYNLNAPTVSDTVYDRHFDELKRLEDAANCSMANSPTQTVGYAVVSNLPKTAHKIPLLSLEKVKDMRHLMRFIGSHQVLVMQKLDGLTVKLEYENGELIRASTRGDGDNGEVITHNARAIDGIPGRIPYNERLVVVGEAFITKPTFEKLRNTLRDSSGNHFKNARNMAAGAVRNHNAETCAGRGVQFSPFTVIEGLDDSTNMSNSKNLKLEMLQQFGFTPCEFRLHQKASEKKIEDSISELRTLAEDNGIPIDGIVITYNDIAFSKSCGRTGHHYKDGLAFKFEDGLHQTIFRSIKWTPGRSGELAPVALFDTVEIDGCEVSRATLHNLSHIKKLELMPGCRILVSKRNMIIPCVEDNLDRGKFKVEKIYPMWCPTCRSRTRLDRTGVAETVYCDNANCAAQLIRKFVHFVEKKAMDIAGLSEATIEKFIRKGWLREFPDIYRLDKYEWEICNMTEGFGRKSWERLWSAIQKSRHTTFERYLVAMDIPMVGRTASRELSRRFDGDLNALEAAVKSGFDFKILSDFGEVLHANIHAWFAVEENIKLWKELQTMVFIEDKNTGTATEATPFYGKTVVVTGKLEHFSRNTINERIESLGAKAGSAVSKNTDFLVAGDKAGSKLAKAKELGVTVLTEHEFINMATAA